MKTTTKYTILAILLFIAPTVYAQLNTSNRDIPENDIYPPYEPEIQLRSSRPGSAEDLYTNLNAWIPRLTPNEPLKNPLLGVTSRYVGVSS